MEIPAIFFIYPVLGSSFSLILTKYIYITKNLSSLAFVANNIIIMTYWVWFQLFLDS